MRYSKKAIVCRLLKDYKNHYQNLLKEDNPKEYVINNKLEWGVCNYTLLTYPELSSMTIKIDSWYSCNTTYWYNIAKYCKDKRQIIDCIKKRVDILETIYYNELSFLEKIIYNIKK